MKASKRLNPRWTEEEERSSQRGEWVALFYGAVQWKEERSKHQHHRDESGSLALGAIQPSHPNQKHWAP